MRIIKKILKITLITFTVITIIIIIDFHQTKVNSASDISNLTKIKM